MYCMHVLEFLSFKLVSISFGNLVVISEMDVKKQKQMFDFFVQTHKTPNLNLMSFPIGCQKGGDPITALGLFISLHLGLLLSNIAVGVKLLPAL